MNVLNNNFEIINEFINNINDYLIYKQIGKETYVYHNKHYNIFVNVTANSICILNEKVKFMISEDFQTALIGNDIYKIVNEDNRKNVNETILKICNNDEINIKSQYIVLQKNYQKLNELYIEIQQKYQKLYTDHINLQHYYTQMKEKIHEIPITIPHYK